MRPRELRLLLCGLVAPLLAACAAPVSPAVSAPPPTAVLADTPVPSPTTAPTPTPAIAPTPTPMRAPPVAEKQGAALWTGDFDLDRWMDAWRVTKVSWGRESMQRLRDPSGRFGDILRVRYPKGSASPTVTRDAGAPVGGAQFYATLGLAPRDSLHLRYYMRFAEGFDFVKGGKLPGLYGGTVHSGGHVPDGTNGLSTRYMWRRSGDGEVYAYLPPSEDFGTSLGRGAWRFQPGRWYLLEQAVTLNAPGQRDGRVRVWVDEKPMLDQGGLLFRTVDSLKIEGLFFSTFFGGDDRTWAAPGDTYVDFARFAVAEGYIGP